MQQVAKVWGKWRKYSTRYGVVHTVCGLVGRRSPKLWRAIGPHATAEYLREWLNNQNEHILNLGGGGNIGCQWLTADVDPRADVFVDIGKRLPFSTGSLDGVFLEEVIEHVTAPAATKVLEECLRCLSPGKPIRISTPDLCWFLNLLKAEGVPPGILYETAVSQLGSENVTLSELRTSAVNSIFRDHGHLFIWECESLVEVLKRVGFRECRRSSYQDPVSPLGRFDSHAERFLHPPEMSIYIDAVK